jgi:hypothetical protein
VACGVTDGVSASNLSPSGPVRPLAAAPCAM